MVVYHGVTGGATTVAETVGANGNAPPGMTGGMKQAVGAYELAGADIVLTTYDVLRCDLAHDDKAGEERKLRYRKR